MQEARTGMVLITGISQIKSAVVFCRSLGNVGGGERLMFEEALHLKKSGIKTRVLTFTFDRKVLFDEKYPVNIKVIQMKSCHRISLLDYVYKILALRSELNKIKPSIIISISPLTCVYLYFATLLTSLVYVTHIHHTIFWVDNSVSPWMSLLKYALVHKKVFKEIRESGIGHRHFIPTIPPKSSLYHRIIAEFTAAFTYVAVRKARKIFVLSNRMKWEVKKLYGKDAIVLKGAFHYQILDYQLRQNIKQKLGFTDKRIIFNVNRLEVKKRVNLLIESFKQISKKFEDVVLIIGGSGPEEGELKKLVKQLNLEDKIKFMGHIREDELWDYYAICDVFVYPDWADFAIAPFEALGLQRKVVWSTDMEIDEPLKTNKHIFTANPTVNDFEKAIVNALNIEIKEENDLSDYTWDKYFNKIVKELEDLR